MENASVHASPSLDLHRRIDDCCDRFETAWKAGQSPQLEAYLEELPEAARPQLLRELLAIEINYRAKLERRQLSKDTFLEAHPRLASLVDSDLEKIFANCTDANILRTERLPPAEGMGSPGRRRSTQRDSRGLHIRCPNCQNPVELLADSPLEEITCGACGDSFSLVEREGQAGSATPLKRIGRFELTSRLGIGGFGTVWKALDTELDRVVALKIPRKGQLSPNEAEQFFREARAAAQLKHPNIVPVHEVGREDDTIFIVTDLIHGVSLAAWLKEVSPSAREAAALCALVADALHFAHLQGVVHRDLKPANVMIDVAGQPHLMDFGLAKREIGEVTMTVEGQILGTPAYMSPEQAQGQTSWIDRRTDIYSLGVVLYEMLTRELPYRGGVQQQIQQRIRDDAPSPRKLNSHVPIDLATICLKCLERDPNRRYTTAADLSAELHRYLRGEPIKARPISRPARIWRWAKRNPALAAAAVLTVSLAVGGPVAAITIESARRTMEAQRNKIQSQLDERDAVIAEYERQRDVQSGRLQALSEQHGALLAASPGIERIVPQWRRSLIVDYLEQHEATIHAALQNEKLSPEARAQAQVGLAYLLYETDRRSEALVHFEAASVLLSELIEEHADADSYRLAFADCLMQISELQRAQNRKREAQGTASRALAIRKDLASRHPTSATYQVDYFDSTLSRQSLMADIEPSAIRREGEQAMDVRKELEQRWSAAPTDLYELSCYLTLRRPLLITERQTDESP